MALHYIEDDGSNSDSASCPRQKALDKVLLQKPGLFRSLSSNTTLNNI
jgi:hypothetical protein